MTTRAQALIPITIAAVIIGVIGLLTLPSDSKLESVAFPMGTVTVDGIPLQVQIADSEPRRTRGLMFQDPLPYDQGMIFVFSEPGIYSFWMLNLQFPLDIIWFDAQGRVVHIVEDAPPCKTTVELVACESMVPDVEALYVLEVTSGFVKENNITKDSMLSIISI